MSDPVGQATVFDAMAERYDQEFSRSVIGTLMRETVHRILDRTFIGARHILELGCGTGEDALHLARRGHLILATDAGENMIEVASRKVQAAELQDRITLCRFDMERLTADREDFNRLTGSSGVMFEGAFSDFGAINCIQRFDVLSEGLAACLVSGAPVIMCIMGPIVPWEWIHFVLRMDFRRAFRRLRRGGVSWRGITIRYPTISRIRRDFEPYFRYRSVTGIGCLLPPTYLEAMAVRHRAFIERLNRIERLIESTRLVPWLSDHYVIEFERR